MKLCILCINIKYFSPQNPLIEATIWPVIFSRQLFPPGLLEDLGRIARELNIKVQVKYY